MGAVTCFLYLEKPLTIKHIKAVVFDSGFASLSFLAQEVAREKTGMPGILVDPILGFVGNTIQEKCGINVLEMDLTKNIHNIYIPCYFVCSKEDKFIKCEHSE